MRHKPHKSLKRKQIVDRLIVFVILAIGCNIALYVVAVFFLQTRSQDIQAHTGVITTSATIVQQLVTDPVQSFQWFSLEPGGVAEQIPQQGGIADSWPNPLPPTVRLLNTKLGESVVLGWQASAGQSYDGVEIYRAITNPPTIDDMELITTALGQAGEWIDTAVENNVTYYYALRSYRGSAASRAVSKLTDVYSVIPTDSTPPEAPQWVAVTPYPEGLEIQWEKPLSADTVEFTLYRSTQLGQFGTQIQTMDPTVTAVRDTTVKPGINYYYAVTASDAAGNESSRQLWTTAHGNTAPFVSSEEQAIERNNGN